MVRIEDIAHHLAHVCRWAGAPKAFWSVAQHSVIVSYITPPRLVRLAQWALLHDAAEAYIGDITRPLKTLLPGVREIEDRIMLAIADHFHMSYPEPEELCTYDDQVQRLEAELIMPQHDGKFVDRTGTGCTITALTAAQQFRLPRGLLAPISCEGAEILFVMRFAELFPESIV
jgi:hypothetical protein